MNCPLCLATPLERVDTTLGDFFRCAQCDLISRSPEQRLGREAEKSRYETHNNDVTDPRYQDFVRPVVDAICSHFPAGHGLDFGAGTGPVVFELFAQRGYAMQRYDPFFWPDTAPLKSRFDFVCATEVVEHFFSPAQEFRLLHGLLKPEGFLGIMTHLHDAQTDFARWYYLKDPTHVVFYSKQTFEWIARQFGFLLPKFPHSRVVLLKRTSGD